MAKQKKTKRKNKTDVVLCFCFQEIETGQFSKKKKDVEFFIVDGKSPQSSSAEATTTDVLLSVHSAFPSVHVAVPPTPCLAFHRCHIHPLLLPMKPAFWWYISTQGRASLFFIAAFSPTAVVTLNDFTAPQLMAIQVVYKLLLQQTKEPPIHMLMWE